MSLKKWALRVCLLLLATFVVVAAPKLLYAAPNPGNSFDQHNLVSDLPGVAYLTDPNLVNPWGVSFSATSPFWVSDNGTGVSTIYTAVRREGCSHRNHSSAAGGSGSAPTGQVNGFGGASFIFATEDGTIAAWAGRNQRGSQGGQLGCRISLQGTGTGQRRRQYLHLRH